MEYYALMNMSGELAPTIKFLRQSIVAATKLNSVQATKRPGRSVISGDLLASGRDKSFSFILLPLHICIHALYSCAG